MRVFTLCLVIRICFFAGVCFSQEYPRWFLHQGELKGSDFAIGYANASGLSDSSKSYARINAKENALIYRGVNISGGELFWSTEGGTYWLGTNVIEKVIPERETFVPKLKLLELYESIKLSIVLIGDSENVIPLEMNQVIKPSQAAPAWIESIPTESKAVYAVGIAPDYYYESSSWQEAERVMRKNLARSFFVSIKMLGKKDINEGQSMKKTEVNIDLYNILVVERWWDMENRIYYVLGKIEL
ncbi:MAG: hypothetical protein WAV76_07190 [Bacteroidota bacterium]